MADRKKTEQIVQCKT